MFILGNMPIHLMNEAQNENSNGLLREFIPKGCSLKRTKSESFRKDIQRLSMKKGLRRIHGYQSSKKAV